MGRNPSSQTQEHRSLAWSTVTAVTGENPMAAKISAILVPAGTPWLTVSKEYDKVGWNASDTHELSFVDVRVPESNLVGERGRGYAVPADPG